MRLLLLALAVHVWAAQDARFTGRDLIAWVLTAAAIGLVSGKSLRWNGPRR